MAELYDITTATLITPIVESLEKHPEINQVVNYNFAGELYLQIIGSPKNKYEVVCYAPRDKTNLLETAWTSGDTIRITMSHGTYYGKIIDFQKSTLPQNYFKMELTLSEVPNPESNQNP